MSRAWRPMDRLANTGRGWPGWTFQWRTLAANRWFGVVLIRRHKERG